MDQKRATGKRMKRIFFMVATLMTVISCQQSSSDEFKWRWHDIRSLSILSDESILAGSRDGDLLVWNLATGDSQVTETANKGAIAAASGELVALVDAKKNLQILSRDEFTVLSEIETGAFAHSVSFSGQFLVVDQSLHGPLVFDVSRAGRKIEPVLLQGLEKVENSDEVALHLPSAKIAAGVLFKSGLFSPDYGLSVWKTDGSLLWQKGGEKGLINGLEFSPDGKLLVTADKAGWLKIWRVSDGKILQEKKLPRGFTAARFLHDGKRIVTGDFSGKLVVWSVDSLEAERTIQAQEEGYMPVIVMKDGRIVTGGSNGLIRIIDLTKQAQ